MSSPTFLQGAGLALAAAAAAGVFMTAGAPILGPGAAFRVLVSGLGFAYVAYLCTAAPRRTGVATALLLWTLASAAAWLASPSNVVFTVGLVAALPLMRSFLLRRRPLQFAADVALNAAAATLALAALSRTGSVALAVWSFFLLQAVHVAIPALLPPHAPARAADDDVPFDAARRRAEAAVEQLASRRTY